MFSSPAWCSIAKGWVQVRGHQASANDLGWRASRWEDSLLVTRLSALPFPCNGKIALGAFENPPGKSHCTFWLYPNAYQQILRWHVLSLQPWICKPTSGKQRASFPFRNWVSHWFASQLSLYKYGEGAKGVPSRGLFKTNKSFRF